MHPWSFPRPKALMVFLGMAVASSACGSAPAPPPGPAVDAGQVVPQLERRTRLLHPVRVLFDWKINESGARFQGRGIARMEPDYKARLDLFLANGEAVVSAALVEDDLRLPGLAPPGLIPPPPLLWASLGVFRPGSSSELLSAEAQGEDGIRLRYLLPSGRELTYELRAGRIVQAELLSSDEVAESMVLERDQGGSDMPSRALYRNIAAFRELEVSADRTEQVESFPPEIWSFAR